jgi:hypothetical protein
MLMKKDDFNNIAQSYSWEGMNDVYKIIKSRQSRLKHF